MGDQLDQIWYTWSTSGLGSNAVGYRVRAASEGLRDLQSLRYRKIDRYLSYELPQGTNYSEVNPAAAPISLAFVHNGDERLLVRKMFRGRDLAGRQSVYFTHLIAGLPDDFTARDAICLWHWSGWTVSEEGKAASDTSLERLSYSEIKKAVQRSQPQDFGLVREQLVQLLRLILMKGMPKQVCITGPSALVAAFLYGLTHALPMTFLGDQTFSTYESVPQGRGETVVGTISAEQIQAGGIPVFQLQLIPPAEPPDVSSVPADIEQYIQSALDNVSTDRFRGLIAVAENQHCSTVDELLDLFQLRFRRSPLKPNQLKLIVNYPQNNLDILLDQASQHEVAAMLVRQSQYWPKTGKTLFAEAFQRAAAATVPQEQGQVALAGFINGIVGHVIDDLVTAIARFSGDWTLIIRCEDILNTLAPSSHNAALWHTLFMRLSQEPIHSHICSDSLWDLLVWLLQSAAMMKPPLEQQQIMPWLRVPSWEKLDKVLSFDPAMHAEWEYVVIWQRVVESLPKKAVAVVQKHEAKFKYALGFIAQQLDTQSLNIVVQFFQALAGYGYLNKVGWLIFLLNSSKDPSLVERLFASVPFYSERQLVATEIDTVLEACSPAVIAASSTAPSLMTYLQEYVQNFTPEKLARESAHRLLRQLSTLPLSGNTIQLVDNWLCVADFMVQAMIDHEKLVRVSQSIQHIIQILPSQMRGGFTAKLVGLLVSRVEEVIDLVSIIDILGPSLASSPWDLLCWMAEEAGIEYGHRKELSRLTPYLYAGIRETIRWQKPFSVLDTYLDALYANTGHDALKQVNSMVTSEAWPENMRLLWGDWYSKRENAGAARIPIIGQFLAQGQKQRHNTQSRQEQGVQQPPQAQGKLVLPDPALAAGQVPATYVQAGQHIMSPTKDAPLLAVIVFSGTNKTISILFEHYQKAHGIMKYLLAYWIYYLEGVQRGRSTKSLATEISLLRDIMLHLQDPKKTQRPSKDLAEYLVEDQFIQQEIDRLIKERNVSRGVFDMGEKLREQSRELQMYMASGEPGRFQKLEDRYGLEDVFLIFSVLIRRALFIDYLEGEGQRLQVWLSQERRKTIIQYHNI